MSVTHNHEGWRLAAFTVPFVLYLVLTSCAGSLPGGYPVGYAVAVVVTGVATFALLRNQQILRPHRHIMAAVVVGLVGIVCWIVLCSLRLEETITAGFPSWMRPKPRAGFDPFTEFSHYGVTMGFIVVRLFGLAVITPIAEELFWRGFLLRWIISPNWEDVPLGKFSLPSFAVVTLLFTSAHPEWFAAICYCALLNLFMYWKKDLWSCVAAHAVSNLVLGVYVLATQTWSLW